MSKHQEFCCGCEYDNNYYNEECVESDFINNMPTNYIEQKYKYVIDKVLRAVLKDEDGNIVMELDPNNFCSIDLKTE